MPTRPLPVPPPFLRRALIARLEDVAQAWDAGQAVAPTEVAALEQLLARAVLFGEADAAAMAWFEALAARVGRAELPPARRARADAKLADLGRMIAEFEAGRAEAEDFTADFAHLAERLDQLLADPREDGTPLPDPTARLAAVRATLTRAHLPRFAALAAGEALARLAGLVLAAPTGVPEPAFRRAFDEGVLDLEGSVALGEVVAGELARARARFEALRAVADRADLSPLLRGPLAEDVEMLRALLGRLEGGTLAPVDFHEAFDGVASSLETLIGWQATLDQARLRLEADEPAPAPAERR